MHLQLSEEKVACGAPPPGETRDGGESLHTRAAALTNYDADPADEGKGATRMVALRVIHSDFGDPRSKAQTELYKCFNCFQLRFGPPGAVYRATFAAALLRRLPCSGDVESAVVGAPAGRSASAHHEHRGSREPPDRRQHATSREQRIG